MPFFGTNGQRLVHRHKLNDRKQDQVLQTYVTSVKQRGIVKGVRGDCWLMIDTESAASKQNTQYFCLTWGTLRLGQSNHNVRKITNIINMTNSHDRHDSQTVNQYLDICKQTDLTS